MLNFTGQTRRRNINLGNRNRTTKNDLLQNAQREREKRANEKLQNTMITRIQKKIRMYQQRMKTVNLLLNKITVHQAKGFFLVYGGTILQFFARESFLKLCKLTKNGLHLTGDSFSNIQICNMMLLTEDSEILELLLDMINISQHIDLSYFLHGINNYFEKSPIENFKISQKISKIIEKWITLDKSTLTSLYCKDICKMRTPMNYLFVINELIRKNLIPITIYEDLYEVTDIIRLLNNLVAIKQIQISQSGAEEEEEKENNNTLILIITKCLDKISPEIAENYQKELQPILDIISQKTYIDQIYLISQSQNNNIQNYDIFLLLLMFNRDIDSRYSLLITLLGNPFILSSLMSKFGKTPTTTEVNSNQFQLLVQLLDFKLTLMTDHELLYGDTKNQMHNDTNQTSTISLIELKNFTIELKNVIFRTIWENGQTNQLTENQYNDCLNLLKKIYLKDSRTRMFQTINETVNRNGKTNDETKDFWSINDKDFQRINISNEMNEYEHKYRVLINENEEEEDYEDDGDVVMKQGNDRSYNKETISRVILNIFSNSSSFKTYNKQYKKLRILIEVPFFIPFHERIELFNLFIAMDKSRLRINDEEDGGININNLTSFLTGTRSSISMRQHATISRKNLLKDAFESFNKIGERFKGKLSVQFKNEFDEIEVGIDGGGISKEFLTSLCAESFNGDSRLFQNNEQYEIYPKVEGIKSEDMRYYWFLGKVIGKCLYEHTLVDVQFAPFFLRKLLNYKNQFKSNIDDLNNYDPTIYENLMKLIHMNEEELMTMDLSFKKNGEDEKVNKRNVIRYLMEYCNRKLNEELNRQTRAFHGGLSVIIAPHWMDMFNSIELQELISGDGNDIDLMDLKNNINYGIYDQKDLTIQYLWEVLEEMDSKERLKFVKFVTSIPRAPLQGFGSLNPKFGIHNAGDNTNLLPTASTCVNLLKLPNYRNKELLRSKLLYAINAGAGFDLS
ncbi:hypothetical protein TBLA_0B07030 [Henningerozyma blattae CBS 6284]|uniref:HECT-type E3 ubiquitin transferase n=1 Tax=Henningerozyma blattae (strain ATCC 34711 / CBS 6284 / DSM 70876 / NBRC 10599 / NRRL Y-10934 / UCD 77-7) TaxID=1071380 RepID=I2GZH0_HENB6|nr:hypothetical protein TBLA_0B07030 [Tetrapisispora blattae CBS 6284]CCH59522.1 hypothetical protein TBLA_0B07030 [Tetrapisispora blattae CBS 6284]